MKKASGKLLALLAASQLALSACSNDQDTSGESFAADSKVDVTWTAILHTASPPTDVIHEKIEKLTNSDITFNWVPDASKEERITAALASGELSEIVSLTMLTNSSVRQSLKSGMFWDVEKYLDDYENLKMISKDMRKAASIDGKLYGVPFQKDLARSGLLLRKDWLDKLGLDVPTNLDELYEVAKAFTEDDPDGNGKDDTFGFSDRNELKYGSFKTLSSYFGAPNTWAVDESGKFSAEFETQAYRDTMKYSRDLYKNGYMDRDFAVTPKNNQIEKFAQGKAGIFTGLVSITQLQTMAEGIQDEMEIVPVNKIKSPDGEYHIWSENSGVGGLMAFPKSEVKSENHLKRLLQFIDDLIGKEAFMLMTGGIEGTHYEFGENEEFKIIDNDLWQKDVQPFSSSRPSEITHTLIDGNPGKQKVNEQIKENASFAVLDPTLPLESQTANERGTELEKLIIDATIQYIMGDIDDKGFDEQVEKWKKSGGDAMKEEFEASYKETNS
ncbi:extracellular solute-binding protein [Pradoshia sp. D12]|uniref:extracellular solute-binding protein n=1 Tax=Bacillaceae TaxID=186817 RepID=UPI00080AEB68|nr:MULTISPECIES: extracellular solute-binding protein [Bacillaceae]OCA89395.1 sugar ABC transporter substrate-binding protein [Bacillus sp. FJAT-27986]QFK71224.1 extracellular solute-binding protein [Pradoshia sp. D12]TPF73017.1 extracellular solute-binding protein [Bacillus sp. D12]